MAELQTDTIPPVEQNEVGRELTNCGKQGLGLVMLVKNLTLKSQNVDVEIALARLREAQTSLQQRIDFAALHADRRRIGRLICRSAIFRIPRR